MRGWLVLILVVLIACDNEQGFTNKAEAKNEIVNGLKEGKWIEYRDSTWHFTKDTNTPFYRLVVYKSGEPYGITREYLKSGELISEIPYLNGKINGIKKDYQKGKIIDEIPITEGKANGLEKMYYENGALECEYPFINGKENGVEKRYSESGKLASEIPFSNDKRNGIAKYFANFNGDKYHLYLEVPYTNGNANGVVKEYYESGTLKSQTSYTNGIKGATIKYDENGKPKYSVTIDSSLLK